ncbi:imidazole glycerol phosphate synthase subunit HisF [Buchnera aphidicola]|uniref:Imidazole glycerol phosphate synthase subunit HisF n=1 Tax=Buchnera aphidicola (Sarucallis kahawaluokalani) TaxID=1241878 RepID=A0A4D6YHR4_9GAMM|nr:imidazole glycerol phosphate synthase subunit HisF [Buchnera aphidicola]QCI25881.1 imidazole glycerol phosphate synthase subunit HisF [Buchnera aphidicola (Sarucallis kahawaluokalani)]
MLAKRIIPCLDVREGHVVKGIQFRNHVIVGNIVHLAKKYVQDGADELVFYDIYASTNQSLVHMKWIRDVAAVIDVPFCVAGGIRNISDVKNILSSGADKVSINSSAINEPDFITRIADRFGSQCVVVGIDSWYDSVKKKYLVYQYTGRVESTKKTRWNTVSWVKEVQKKGAGEIVLNVMNQDGLCTGYDIQQLKEIKQVCNVPLIASGGAGTMKDFYHVFQKTNVDGALAASVFHKNIFTIRELKYFLSKRGIRIRIC